MEFTADIEEVMCSVPELGRLFDWVPRLQNEVMSVHCCLEPPKCSQCFEPVRIWSTDYCKNCLIEVKSTLPTEQHIKFVMARQVGERFQIDCATCGWKASYDKRMVHACFMVRHFEVAFHDESR